MSERAISDVLGYALVFALILSTVGVVYTTGVGGLLDVRETEKIANAERAFDVLDSNLEDLSRGAGDSRGTEIQLKDATIGFEDPTIINVSADEGGSYRAAIRPIYFAGSEDDPRIVAENGGIFRQQDETAVIRNEPNFVFADQEMVVPIVVTRTRASERSGSGRVLVRTTVADRTVVRLPADSNVTVRIESPRATAWKEYLEDESGETCQVTGNVTTCTIDTSEAYVQVVRVEVSFV